MKLSLMAVVLLTVVSAYAALYRVSTNGGESWADADSLSAAITAATTDNSIIELMADDDTFVTAETKIEHSVVLRSSTGNGNLKPFTIRKSVAAGCLRPNKAGKTVAVTNIVFDGNAKWSNANIIYFDQESGGVGQGKMFYLVAGELHLGAGAVITNLYGEAVSSSAKNAIVLRFGEGAKIVDCRAAKAPQINLSYNGANKASLYMTGGIITNCYNNNDSRSLYNLGIVGFYGVSHSGSMNITGGEISGNKVYYSDGGGALYATGPVRFSGSPRIYGNAVRVNDLEINVNIPDSQNLILDGELGDSAFISVAFANPVLGATFGVAEGAYRGAKHFLPDNYFGKPKLNGEVDDGKLVWGRVASGLILMLR